MKRVLIILFFGLLFAIYGLANLYYPVKVSNGLYYPKRPGTIFLIKDKVFEWQTAGYTEQGYLLKKGKYTEVLTNEYGSFYLSPELGFYKNVFPDIGYAVGGIFVPSDQEASPFVWEYSLKFKDKSPINPDINRLLSKTKDQPDRELFLNPVWYSSKGFTFTGRPLVKKSMPVSRSEITTK